jgi:uncharacterized membrane-anchored protein YhcB (DUF1043 family)
MSGGSFISWLQSLHNLPIFAIVVGVLVGLVLLTPQLARRLLRVRADEKTAHGASEAYKAVVSFAVFLLAFSFVQVQGQLQRARDAVTREANTFNTIDRLLWRLDIQGAVPLRDVLHGYAASIVNDEWKLLALGDRSEATERYYNALSQGAAALLPGTARQDVMYTRLLALVDEAGDLRETRIAATDQSTTDLFWWTVVAILAVAIVLAALTPPTLERALSDGALMAAAGLMVSLVVITDGPFEGETSLQPIPIERVIAVMSARN